MSGQGKYKMKKKKELDKWLLLTWKKILLIIFFWFGAVILHNLVYALFFKYFQSTGGDEFFFFIISVLIIPIYFLIALFYTLVKMIKDKSIFKKDFLIKFLTAIILGVLATLLIIKFNLINPEMGFMLSAIFIIFAFLFYGLTKLTKQRKK